MNGETNLFDELIVDNFAGGGGASTGIEMATGRTVDIAINHDPAAILMHKTNHPYTTHYQASVWDIDPVEVCGGHPVGLAWFSPDCKHFSKAKGAALVDRNIRGLAWIVLRWAAKVRPRVIILENVEEFQTWGPVRKGKPVKSKSGKTFRQWKKQLSDLGYVIEHRELVAADYGAPTTRKRFYLIARCDGKPIEWPKQTHSKDGADGLKPWVSAADILDFTIPCPSIFKTSEEIQSEMGLSAKRPLKENTLRRVTRGIDKFVLKADKPFIIPIGYGEKQGQKPRIHDVDKPLPTPVGTVKHNLCEPVLIQYHTEQTDYTRASALSKPLSTVDGSNRIALTAPVLTKYYSGADNSQRITDPVHTITVRPRECLTVTTIVRYSASADMRYWPKVRELLNKYAGYKLADDEVILLLINGAPYYIADIGLRMLTPKELYRAQGFPPDYIIDHDYTGKDYPKSAQVARCGNAVCPPVATALVKANMPEWCEKIDISTMAALLNNIAV